MVQLKVNFAKDADIPAAQERNSQMELRDSATTPVELSTAEQPSPVDRDCVSTSILDYGQASDEQLLEAAKSGNEHAFVELCGRSTSSLRKRLFRILENREDAEDALQDSLFKAYTHLGEFRGSCKFSSWLTRIAINTALMQLRKKRSLSEMSFQQRGDDDQTAEDCDFPDPSPNAERVYARRETIDLLTYAAQQLPSSYKGIVTEYHEKERSLQEAADILGITITAAKSRLLRARLTMRAALKRKCFSMADAYF